MIEPTRLSTALRGTEEAMDLLQGLMERAEAALDDVQRTLEAISIVTAAGEGADARDRAIKGAIASALGDVEARIDAAEAAIEGRFDPAALLDSLDEGLREVEQQAADTIGDTAQHIDETAAGVAQELDKAIDILGTHVDGWIDAALDVEALAEDQVASLIDSIDAAIPMIDRMLEDIVMTDLQQKLADMAGGASAFLQQVEGAVDQAGGALFDGIGGITEKVGSVQEVLETIKPLTEAFDALT